MMRRALPFLSIAFLLLPLVASAQTCPAGTHPATAADIPYMTAAGIPNPAVGTCWDSNNANAGKAVGEAKLFIQQHATKGANVSCMNSDFAQRLANFMKAVPGGPPTVTSGYRGQAAQTAAKNSGASEVGWCHSYHNYGMAADFNNADKKTLLWMRENAPQYGIAIISTFSPITGCSTKSSFCDPAHFQIAGSLPSQNQCGVCSSTVTAGNGTLPVPPGTPPEPAIPDDAQFYIQYPYATPTNGAYFPGSIPLYNAPGLPYNTFPTNSLVLNQQQPVNTTPTNAPATVPSSLTDLLNSSQNTSATDLESILGESASTSASDQSDATYTTGSTSSSTASSESVLDQYFHERESQHASSTESAQASTSSPLPPPVLPTTLSVTSILNAAIIDTSPDSVFTSPVPANSSGVVTVDTAAPESSAYPSGTVTGFGPMNTGVDVSPTTNVDASPAAASGFALVLTNLKTALLSLLSFLSLH